MNTLTNNMNITGDMEYLGTGKNGCLKGYSFFRLNRTVFQYHPIGFFQGWICSYEVWERGFKNIID
jgi:hypothetical protein